MIKEVEKKCIQASVLNGTIDFDYLDTERRGFAVGIFIAAINQGKISDDMFSSKQKEAVNETLELLAQSN